MSFNIRSEAFPVGARITAGELAGDPHAPLARLRAAEPVSWLPALDGWLVTRHDLAVRVMRDATTFTVDDPRFSTARVVGPSMLSLDGPAHTRHRDPFARPFRPARTRERFAAFVTGQAAARVAALAPAGRAELRGALAGPLAVAVVAEALGLDGVDAATVRSWYAAFVDAVSDLTAGRPLPADAAHARARLRAAVEASLPSGAGVLGEAAAHPAGLATAELVSDAAVLMFGGIDTTESMIVNAVAALLAHPAELDRVRADPGLLPGAIEESLRHEPAAAVVDRYATADVELGGAPVRAGDLVRVSLTAANRDPEVFPDPDRFDVGRPNAGAHLAFAHGPHICFGATLARLETTAALTALLERLPGLRADGPVPPARGLVFRRPDTLPVRWDDAPARH
ncbi:cytochrome P450 [Actinomadura flavalba]|uniref:cytochrome P450 n=1 Tax=Actinomadura flavalba TaxID=1120938 RepID=UPI00035D9129|nr:cytochrome P450 [Actinomadura flavalba]